MASGHAPVIKCASGMVGDDSNSVIGSHTRKSLIGSEIDVSGIGKGTSALANSRTAAQGGIHPPKIESAFGSGVGSISGLNMHDDDKSSNWKNSSNFLKNRNKSQVSGFRASRDKLPGITTHQKLQMFDQRCQNQIFNLVKGVDRSTINNVYHVSEFCSDIQ